MLRWESVSTDSSLPIFGVFHAEADLLCGLLMRNAYQQLKNPAKAGSGLKFLLELTLIIVE